MDNCIGFILCKPLDNRIVGKVKGWDKKKRSDLLVVKITNKAFFVRNLLFKLLQIWGGCHHFGKCHMIIRIDEEHIKFRQILSLPVRWCHHISNKKGHFVRVWHLPFAGASAPFVQGILSGLIFLRYPETSHRQLLKPPAFRSPHRFDVRGEKFFSFDLVHVTCGRWGQWLRWV